MKNLTALAADLARIADEETTDLLALEALIRNLQATQRYIARSRPPMQLTVSKFVPDSNGKYIQQGETIKVPAYTSANLVVATLPSKRTKRLPRFDSTGKPNTFWRKYNGKPFYYLEFALA